MIHNFIPWITFGKRMARVSPCVRLFRRLPRWYRSEPARDRRTDTMAARKWFSSFFPTVKAQEEEDIVDPQTVLRVRGSKGPSNVSATTQTVAAGCLTPDVIVHFRKSVPSTEAHHSCGKSTRHVTNVLAAVPRRPKPASRSCSITCTSWITALQRPCFRSWSKHVYHGPEEGEVTFWGRGMSHT